MDDIKQPAAKAASSALLVLSSLNWGQIAQMLAALYTLCLITEWMWKRILKPLAQRWGWVSGPRKEFLDSTQQGEFEK